MWWTECCVILETYWGQGQICHWLWLLLRQLLSCLSRPVSLNKVFSAITSVDGWRTVWFQLRWKGCAIPKATIYPAHIPPLCPLGTVNYIKTSCRHKGAINILKYKKGTELNSKGNLQISLFENWLRTCVDIVKRRCTNGQQIGTKVLGNNHQENGNQICSERSSHLLCWPYRQRWELEPTRSRVTPCTRLLKCELVQQLLKTLCVCLQTLTLELLCILAVPVLGVYPSQSPKVVLQKYLNSHTDWGITYSTRPRDII